MTLRAEVFCPLKLTVIKRNTSLRPKSDKVGITDRVFWLWLDKTTTMTYLPRLLPRPARRPSMMSSVLEKGVGEMEGQGQGDLEGDLGSESNNFPYVHSKSWWIHRSNGTVSAENTPK